MQNKPADQQNEWQGNHQPLDPSSELSTFPMLVFADGIFVMLHFRKMIPVHNKLINGTKQSDQDYFWIAILGVYVNSSKDKEYFDLSLYAL